MKQLNSKPIIDFHTHTFPRNISLKALESLSNTGHVRYFTEGSVEALAESMEKNNIDCSVNLPVMTRLDQVVQINDNMIKNNEQMLDNGIVTFGGLHPKYDDYKAEIKRLKNAGIKGIKLHPAFQGVHINNVLYKNILDAISNEGMISIIHCGIDISFLDENYASVPELIEVIDEVGPEKMVLAHLGGWQAWQEVERDLAGAPVFLDTAYAFGPVYPREGQENIMQFKMNLDNDSFTKLARKHGTDKVLFATDSPWADQGEYVKFLKNCDLNDKEKDNILGLNAKKLLGL